MSPPVRLHLFQAFGIELEYMIVDRDSLDIRPIADELLKDELTQYGSDFENGLVTWSNELVLHVIEVKSTVPESDFPRLASAFSENVSRINGNLQKWNAMLMPGAAHPWMNPLTETRLWPHDSNEVYEAYNRIFDCKGHGWSNLQSTHLNLPFYDDEEFAKLHAACRLILPLLPALCASSPILDRKLTGFQDTRMNYYRSNQSRIPSITGKVIPEAVFSKRQYSQVIYDKIRTDLMPFDKDNILDPVWVNSRGAMARFDRGSIEIRVMDVQECPGADLAIQTLVVETLRALVNEKFCSLEEQMKIRTEALSDMLDATSRSGQSAEVVQEEILQAFRYSGSCNARKLWQHILETLLSGPNSPVKNWLTELNTILTHGSLAERIIFAVKKDGSPSAIKKTYQSLSECLARNSMFIPGGII